MRMGFLTSWRARRKAPESDTAADRGTTWSAYAERQLKDEQARFNSLDSKGNTLITSSGTFVTLIFAVGALTINRVGYRPGDVTIILALAGLILFVLAAIMGVATTSMATYTAIGADFMERTRANNRKWNMTERAARRYTMKYDILAVKSLRTANSRKAFKLRIGHILQVLGAAILTAAAATALLPALL